MRDELQQLLRGRRGHFCMESGYHGTSWFDLDSLFDDLPPLHPFIVDLAQRFAAYRIDAVCGPMTGGAKLAELIAHHLGAEYWFTERWVDESENGLFPVRYTLPAPLRDGATGKRVAIVDDAISAGSAARGTYADLTKLNANPVVIGALYVFGDTGKQFASDHSLAQEALIELPFNQWKPSECPLCASGVPLERVSDVPKQ